MELIYSKQVLSSIEQYTDALANYPISNDRIRQKVDGMFDALQSIDISRMQICKLGSVS